MWLDLKTLKNMAKLLKSCLREYHLLFTAVRVELVSTVNSP